MSKGAEVALTKALSASLMHKGGLWVGGQVDGVCER
jgi:hypothetical protein